MSWPGDRREYEQQIGVNELDGLIRDHRYLPPVTLEPGTNVFRLQGNADPVVHHATYEHGDTWGVEHCTCRRWARGWGRNEAIVFPSPQWFAHVNDAAPRWGPK